LNYAGRSSPCLIQTLEEIDMVKWECQMFYGDRLYSGHYWTDELSLARARKKVA